MHSRAPIAAGIALSLGLAFALPAGAQEKYPSKPIDLLVPFAPGASTDTGGRIIAQALEARWKVPVRVVNKPGGNTVPAVSEVMTAKPDGTTILVDGMPQSSMLDTVVKTLPFKVEDRTFLAVTSYTPIMMFVPADSPFKTVKDAAESLKKDPGSFTWTSIGGASGLDMAFRQFCRDNGIDVKKTRTVVTKGGSEAVTLASGGHVMLGLGTYTGAAASLSAGKLRMIAVAAQERWPTIPETPTGKEMGFPSLNVEFWVGFSGPPKLPAHIVETWTKALAEIVADPATKEKMAKVGLKDLYEDAATMQKRVARERRDTQDLYK
ncbi:MAG: tripartite tricarboxylate transporter substrate binding protein [Hyphomicrobiaceae bacterium]|nr:tripartite tricarboxylate transporter substrate binding protein [Hyphomicrobiaceae bacterium]